MARSIAVTRSTWLALILILLVGSWLRVNDLAQIPPGLYHDEAFSGLDALSIVRGAGFPIFFEGNGGREPLFIYLHALSIFIFGPTPFALRLPAAFVGILTLPVFFVLTRALNADRKNAMALALIATAALATFYWHLNFSRVGWRTITLPLLACLAFYFFWRARRTGHLRDHVLTGAFLGASLYTYLSARFLPLVLAAFWVVEFLFVVRHGAEQSVVAGARTRLRFAPSLTTNLWLRNIAVVVATAAVVFLPLAIYFFFHPQAFLFRVTDVTLATGESQLAAIWANVQRVAGIFYLGGDPEWRHGIARRTILDWVTAIPFALGLLAALWRWRKPESWFAFLWLAIMLLPTILSRDAPDTQRAIGALPAVVLLIAWGAEAIVETIAQRLRFPRRTLTLAATALVVLGSGGITYRDYFVTWANDKRAYYDFQGDWAMLAHWTNAQSANVLLPMQLYAEPTIHFLTLSRFSETRSILNLSDAERAQLANEATIALVPATPSNDAFALLRGNSAILLAPNPQTEALIHSQPSQGEWRDPWGKSLGARVALPSSALAEITRPLPYTPIRADFDRQLDLVGYALDNRQITPGKPYRVTLYWSSRAPIQALTRAFVHLLDAQGNVVAESNIGPAEDFHLSHFPQGQIIPDRRVLSPDSALPPGKYALEVGVYQPARDARLPVWIDGAQSADARVLLSPLKVAASIAPIPPAHPLDVRFGNDIALAGFTLDREGLVLLWQAISPADRDYTVFVHVLDSAGKIIAQYDHQPQNGAYPTSIWDAGEQIQDSVNLPLPRGGQYKIVVGLYDVETMQRLNVFGADGQALGDYLVLPVEVGAE
ncbi:MAG: glycosyltransferase family 39 protein [Chloroflexi bacterium]|nr:glycosyltransferase family 39 protein [Chloroflexota bacterium]